MIIIKLAKPTGNKKKERKLAFYCKWKSPTTTKNKVTFKEHLKQTGDARVVILVWESFAATITAKKKIWKRANPFLIINVKQKQKNETSLSTNYADVF